LEWEKTYATIQAMKANIPPKPVHETYLKHRRELKWQILAPVVVSLVLCFACSGLVYAATFNRGGDVALWAQISEIWLAIPTIIVLVIIFALVGGLVFLMSKLLAILPRYTFMAQDFSFKMKTYVRRGADYAAKPVIFLDSLGASINRIFGKR
jgi:ABC-type microcin C transport system permease subunit YejE